MNQNPLLKELYKTDASGKPQPLFELKHGPEPRKAPIVLHHALHALPALEAIDKRIDELLLSLGNRGLSVNEIMDEMEALQVHGCKLYAQTVYLDTSDRNSWASLSQHMQHNPKGNSVYGHHAKNLKSFWKGRLDVTPGSESTVAP